MSQAAHEHQDEPEARVTLLVPVPLAELVDAERERLTELRTEALVPEADPVAAYVAELVAAAPPLAADIRAKLAGLLNSE